MAGNKAKGGRKHRKFGRHARSGAQARYNAENRWERNKKRRVQTHLNRSKKHALKRLMRSAKSMGLKLGKEALTLENAADHDINYDKQAELWLKNHAR